MAKRCVSLYICN